MYEEFYKLSGKPFQLNPDPRFFFSSRGHQRAMSYLRYGIQQKQGFIVITGDVGTGKTMLVNNLFKEIEEHDVVAAKVVSTNINDHDLLRLVAAQFGIDSPNASKAELLREIEQFCRQCVDEGKRVLLVVDECQNLPKAALEELRMLSNFDYQGHPVVQSFLLGQREFRQVMRAPGLEQLRQRVIAAYHLTPLASPEEVREYVEHRLRTVGWNGDPRLDDAVYTRVFEATGGLPRRINTLMDRLVLFGALEGLHTLSSKVLDQVFAEIEDEHGDPDDYIEPEDVLRDPRERTSKAGNGGKGTGASTAGAPPAPAEESQRVHELQARLGEMQQAMENMNRRMHEAATPPPPPPGGSGRRQPAVPPPGERPPRAWTWAFGVTLAIVVAVGGAFVYLVNQQL